MRRLQKFGSILLVLALCLTMLPVTAGAEEPEAADGWDSRADTGWYSDNEYEFTISTAAELAGLAQLVNGGTDFSDKTITLAADIDLAGREWTPIGKDSISSRFNGTFDGGGHTISGLYINKDVTSDTGSVYLGLFGYVGEGTVKKLTVTGSVIGCDNRTGTSDYYAGGIVGACGGDGDIVNCMADVTVTGNSNGTRTVVGGIVGKNSGEVTGCISKGAVSAKGTGTGNVTANAGGIAGESSYGSIINCCNTGSVIGDSCAGGIAGNSSSSEVTNCYNTGEVSGSGTVGGVVGECSFGNISNCYNTGSVSGSGIVGGVIGLNDSVLSTSVSNCYYLAGSESEDAGTGAGKTQAQFASGEVAWLLQDWWDTNAPDSEKGQVLGQKIGEDGAPVLSGDRGRRVYQLIFQAAGTEEIVLYGNSGALRFPADPTPPAGLAFTGWFSGGTKLTETSVISADIVATAQFGTIQEPEPEPEPPSGGSSSRPDPEPSEPPVDVSTGTTTQAGRTPLRPPPAPPPRWRTARPAPPSPAAWARRSSSRPRRTTVSPWSSPRRSPGT